MTKRRPGRDPMDNHSKTAEPKATDGSAPKVSAAETPKVSVVDVELNSKHKLETDKTEAEAMNQQAHETHAKAAHDSDTHTEQNLGTDEGPKVELNFKGSEILRAKFPKPFEVAEKIATDWVHDGRFEGIELGHPLAQYFAAKGLRKAKEIEKKVLESPVTEKVAMGALTAGLKAQEIINQVREKIKK